MLVYGLFVKWANIIYVGIQLNKWWKNYNAGTDLKQY